MFGKIVLVLGVLGTLLSLGIVIVSAALVPLMDGRVSWEEAMIGIIIGAILLVPSFLLAIVGLIVVIKGRKQGEVGGQ